MEHNYRFFFFFCLFVFFFGYTVAADDDEKTGTVKNVTNLIDESPQSCSLTGSFQDLLTRTIKIQNGFFAFVVGQTAKLDPYQEPWSVKDHPTVISNYKIQLDPLKVTQVTGLTSSLIQEFQDTDFNILTNGQWNGSTTVCSVQSCLTATISGTCILEYEANPPVKTKQPFLGTATISNVNMKCEISFSGKLYPKIGAKPIQYNTVSLGCPCVTVSLQSLAQPKPIQNLIKQMGNLLLKKKPKPKKKS